MTYFIIVLLLILIFISNRTAYLLTSTTPAESEQPKSAMYKRIEAMPLHELARLIEGGKQS